MFFHNLARPFRHLRHHGVGVIPARLRSSRKSLFIRVYTCMHLNKDYVERMWSRIKARAKRNGIPFDLTHSDISDLTMPITCPVLGIPLRQERGRQTDNSVSIDRIDSTQGYTPDNVVIVSWKVNRLKSNASLDEMRKMVTFYESIAEDKTNSHIDTTLNTDEYDLFAHPLHHT